MKNTICGIPITQEHADILTKTINNIYEEIKRSESDYFKIQLAYTLRHNPHNTFKGTVTEYIKKYGY